MHGPIMDHTILIKTKTKRSTEYSKVNVQVRQNVEQSNITDTRKLSKPLKFDQNLDK